MININNIFKIIFTFIPTISFCNINSDIRREVTKFNVIQISPGESKPYSICDLPTGVSPTTNTSITAFQSPGFRMFHCNLSQTSITSNDVFITMTIQSMFGSRFSKLRTGQIYLSIYYELIKANIQTAWQTYITSQTPNATDYVISSTTRGISASIKTPSNELSKAINCLAMLYKQIQQIQITNDMITTAYSNMITTCTVSGFTKASAPSSVSTNSADTILIQTAYPRLDVTTLGGRGMLDYPGVPSGGYTSYDVLLLSNNSITSSALLENIKYLHTSTLYGGSFLVFSASNDINVKNSIEETGTNFMKQLAPKYYETFNLPQFGDSIVGGVSNIHSLSSSTSTGGLSIIISLGKISLNSILAAGMIGKKVSDSDLPVFSSSSGTTIYIVGGIVQYRCVISNSLIASPPGTSGAWASFTSSLSSRYSTSTYDSDFTNGTGIVAELIKNFSPGSSNSNANFLTYGVDLIYTDTPKAFVFWMELFYGAFGVMKELRDLNAKSNADKEAAIKNACKSLINSNSCSTSATMCLRMV